MATRPGRFGLLAVLLAAMGWFGPAGLRGEAATVGRISSFGQVRAEGVPVGGLGDQQESGVAETNVDDDSDAKFSA